MKATNIYHIEKLPLGEDELFEPLFKGRSVSGERIISNGQVTQPEKWYNSEANEFVVLQQGKATLEFENGKFIHLKAGDYLQISAHEKHRVIYTSKQPPCIWLAIHFE